MSRVEMTLLVEMIADRGVDGDRPRDGPPTEAGRRLFPSIWFNAEPCSPGLDALSWYHEKHDEARNIGLGPEHDWSSPGADAFGLMCVAYEEPHKRPPVFPKRDMRWVV